MSWISYAAKRVAASLVMLLVASVVIFAIVRLIPGDPVNIILGTQQGTAGAEEALRRQLGLDDPPWIQYVQWLTGLLTGNWGQSIISGQSIQRLVSIRYPRSLQLAFLGIVTSVIIAFPLGIVSAVRRNTAVDYTAIAFSQVGVSVPSFWLGILFIFFFGGVLNVLPPSGYVSFNEDLVESLRYSVMPVAVLTIINGAIITRYLRSEMLEELNKDYVRTARAFGHPSNRIVGRYVLKNALIPTVTVIGIQFGWMVGGIVIIEQVFSYSGLGQLILSGLLSRDYPVVQIGILILAGTFIVVNLVVDLLYGWLDPRVKY
jgi:peptide/nickel transport system permease protein